jgi:hypothetical protein
LYVGVDEMNIDPDGFGDRLFAAVRGAGDNEGDLFGTTEDSRATSEKKVVDLRSDDGAEAIDEIPARSTREYEWLLTFDRAAGNEWQGAEVSFAVALTGECGEAGVIAGAASARAERSGRVLGVSSSDGALLVRFPATGSSLRVPLWSFGLGLVVLAGLCFWNRVWCAVSGR